MPEFSPPSHPYSNYTQQVEPGSSTTASAAGQTSRYDTAPTYQASQYDRQVSESRSASRHSDPGQSPAYQSPTSRPKSR